MEARATVPLRRARKREGVACGSLPPPLPLRGAARDPGARALLLRSLGLHEQQVELAKLDIARVRRELSAVVVSVEAVRGSLDRLALDAEAQGLTPRLQRLQRRLVVELQERRRIEADRRETLLACERKLQHFQQCAASTRLKLSAVAA